MNIALTMDMSRLVTIFIMLCLLATENLAKAETRPLDAEVQQAQAQFFQARDISQRQDKQIRQIKQRLAEINLQLTQLQGQKSSLARAQVKRLHKRHLQLRQLLASRKQSLVAAQKISQTRAEIMLDSIDKLCPANCTDKKLQSLRRQALLYLPSRQKAASQNTTQSRIDKLQDKEERLLRRARVVAQRIRSLHKQQELAGQVRSSLRDQALFDEEERHLQLTRLVQRQQVTTNPGNPNTQEPSSDNVTNQAVDNNPPPSGDENVAVGGIDNSEGSYGRADPNDSSVGRSTTTTSVSQQIHAQRVEPLLGDDLQNLMGDSELPEDMQKLRRLRVELVQKAEQLAAERRHLEASERATRKSE